VTQGKLSVLRMFVLGLLLVNIVLITLRLMQPDDEEVSSAAATSQESEPLAGIELVGDTLPGDASAGLEEAGEPIVAETPEKTVTETVEPEVSSCVRLGPFDSENGMAGLQSELRGLFSRVHTRETKSIADKGYWVYLPPYSTRAEADKAMELLTAAGASDFYVVPRGKSVNAVSLGIFARRERAESRRGQLRQLGLGLDIVVELQTEIQTQYWLEAGPVDALNPALIQLSISHADVQQLQISCPAESIEPPSVVINHDSPPATAHGACNRRPSRKLICSSIFIGAAAWSRIRIPQAHVPA